MNRLAALNRFLEKIMPLLTPSSVVIGVLLADYLNWMAFLVPWVFAFMTFTGSLSSNFNDFRHVLFRPLPLIVCILILHAAVPLLAWGTGLLLYSGDPYTVTGILLAFVIPTGIMSFMWVSINHGNIALTLAVILISTVLSPFAVPYTIEWLVGAQIEFDSWGMMKGLLWMLVLPSLAGMGLNQWTGGRVKETVGKPFSPFSKIGLAFVVSVNCAVAAPFFRNMDLKLVAITATVLVLATASYLIGLAVAKGMRWPRDILVSVMFNSGMRNISAGAVVATAYFPPQVSGPVIVCLLFQQFLASMYTLFLKKRWPGNDDVPAEGRKTPTVSVGFHR